MAKKNENLAKKIFMEKINFSDGLTFDCDIYDANWKFVDVVRFRENIWDYFIDYLRMANSIIEENLKVSNDYMKKKIYYEIDHDEDGDDSSHYILIKCEDWIFPPFSLYCDVKWKPISDLVFNITLWKGEWAPEYFIKFKDLVTNIENIIIKNWEKYNEDLKKEWKETLKQHKKEWWEIDDTEWEKRSMFKKACNLNKCNKVIEKSKKLMAKETKIYKAIIH